MRGINPQQSKNGSSLNFTTVGDAFFVACLSQWFETFANGQETVSATPKLNAPHQPTNTTPLIHIAMNAVNVL